MSLYLSHPSIPGVKINTYPKRRRRQPDILLFPQRTNRAVSVPHEICYADFFATQPAQARQSA